MSILDCFEACQRNHRIPTVGWVDTGLLGDQALHMVGNSPELGDWMTNAGLNSDDPAHALLAVAILGLGAPDGSPELVGSNTR